MNKGYVTVNGQKLYYEIYGQGQPLLLIMGLGGDASQWELQIGDFREHFQVIVFDNRDVGRSSAATGSYSISDMAEDTAALLTALKIKQAHVLGASLGGMVAQELVLRYPAKVQRLILACTMARSMAGLNAPSTQSWPWLTMPPGFNPDMSPFQMMTQLAQTFPLNMDDVNKIMRQMRYLPIPTSAEGVSRQVEAVSRFDALGRLGGVKTPTLVLVGDQDVLTPPWAARELVEAIPGAKLQLLNGGGHGFMWEIPDQFNQAVLTFLTTTPPSQ